MPHSETSKGNKKGTNREQEGNMKGTFLKTLYLPPIFCYDILYIITYSDIPQFLL